METTGKQPAKIITLLTDFGHQDPYVGIMKGVLLGLCPEAQIVDLTHEVIPYQIGQAAFLLEQSWSWFPAGSIHLVVVDPGVGSVRRPVVLQAAGHFFVGPDNGVFSRVPPGEVREIDIGASPASNTFHGRDIFGPAAARLARGHSFAVLGSIIQDPVRLSVEEKVVLHIDRFGNIITSLRSASHPGPITLRVGNAVIKRRAETYAEVPPGELFLIEGSSGYLEIALNQGSAAAFLAVAVGTRL
jgi:S-adenosylmethionine hydrolase